MASISDKTTWSVTCTGLSPVDDAEGKFEVNTVPLTAANLVAQQGLLTTLENAMFNLTVGVVSQRSSAIIKELSTLAPTGVALRGAKWQIKAVETSGNQRTFTYTIPAALIAGQLIAGTTQADLTTAEWTAFKNAFNAVAISPNGQPLAFIGAKYISI